MAVADIGIYGGTFSPPHNGHVYAAKSALDELMLDKLYVVPAFIPPHKQLGFDNPNDRFNMARLAFSGIPKVEVSDYEMTAGGKSYTVKTLEHFKNKGTLTFLCGTDMFLSLEEWYMPEKIFRLARIALVRREADNEFLNVRVQETKRRYMKKYAARIVLLQAKAYELSSTFVRDAISDGNFEGYVPESVAAYIRKNHLYDA